MTVPRGKIWILKYRECVQNSGLQLFHFINNHPNLRLGSPLLDLPLCFDAWYGCARSIAQPPENLQRGHELDLSSKGTAQIVYTLDHVL